MDTNFTVPAPVVGASAATPPITAPFVATLQPSVVVLAIATTPPVPMIPIYAKPFPKISNIEANKNTLPNSETWTHANKVCRHTILTALSNEFFDVYYAYKEAKVIWESMLIKYTTKDVGKQKFVVGNYYKWEMVDDKDIKHQIKEYLLFLLTWLIPMIYDMLD